MFIFVSVYRLADATEMFLWILIFLALMVAASFMFSLKT
jgi:hypothetical protein